MKKTFKGVVSFALVLCMLVSMITVPVFALDLTSIIDIDPADHEKIYFKGETDKDFTTYAVGEEMTFTMTLWADGEQISAPYFKCTLTGDDGGSSVQYLDATSGTVTVKTSLSAIGGVRLVVEPADYSKNVISHDKIEKFQGGALAGASEIRTTVAEPLDFDEFWAEQLALLDECAPDLFSLEQVTSNNSNFDTYVVKVNCIGDPSMISTNATWTAGVLTVPKNASAGSLGFRLTFQGYGVSSAGRSYNNNYVTFSVCAHSMEQLQDSSYYNSTNLGLNNYGFSAAENAEPENSYFRNMLLRDVQAVRFLQKYFGAEGGEAEFNGINTGAWKGLWDGETIFVSGGSQGGFQSISVAALVPEVSRVNASVPWFADVAGNTVSTRLKSTFRPTYADGLRYFDTALMAKRVKAERVEITAGTGDTLCPMYAVQAIYNNMNTNVSLKFTQGQTHGSTDTVPIAYTQTKTTDSVAVEKDGIVGLLGFYSDEALTAFSDAWYALTGREAVMLESELSFEDADVDSNIMVACVDFSMIFVDELTYEELLAGYVGVIETYDLAAYALGFTGEATELNDNHRAILTLAADPASACHLVAWGDDTSDEIAFMEKLAINLSGSIYNNQPKTDVEYKIIGTDGKECSTFVVTDDTSAVSAYPITIPCHALKSANLVTTYKTPEETGETYGILAIKGNGFEKELKVFDSADVTASGVDAGAEWIVQSGVMNIYGKDISDTEYSWNSAMTGVTEIVINEGVKSLGTGAIDVPAGAKISLPFSLETLDDNAFCGNTDFTLAAYEATVGAEFAEEKGIDFVSLGTANNCGTDVYWRYSDGTLTIFGTGTTIESGVKGWGKPQTSAWYEHYDEITKVVIEGDITTIGTNAFHYMSKLKTVELSKNVTTVGQGAFETCGSLTTIYVTGNEPVEGTADLSYITKLTGGYIFDGTPNIENYILSDSLTSSIQTETFKTNSGGGKMTALTVPASVPGIGALVFSGNKNFKTLTVLGKETTISEYAFANYTDSSKSGYVNNVGNVTIVAYEGSAAQQFAKDNMIMFRNIETGEEIDYSVVADGEVVLSGELGDNIKFSVVRIGDTETFDLIITGTGSAVADGYSASADLPYAEYSDKIVKVTVRGGTSIGSYAFADMTNLERVELSGKINTLGNYVFANCGKLNSIYISDTTVAEGQANLAAITSFGEGCFEGTAITAVNMSKSITDIPAKAFKDSALTEVTLSEKIENVSAEAFCGCSDLSSVTIMAQQYSIDSDAFKELASDAVITAYEDTAAEEMAEANGYTFDSMGEIPHTVEGEIVSQYINVAWVFDEITKVLTVTTTKSGWNESGGVNLEGSWAKIVAEIEEVVLVGNMSKISGQAFKGAVNLKKVTMPSSISQIDLSAFDGCTNLTTVQVAGAAIMDNVVNLGSISGNGSGGSCLSGGSNIFRNADSVTAMVLGKVYSDEHPIIASNVPANLETIYGSTEYLADYCAENGYEFVPFGYATTSNAYWTINTETQTLTLHGEGTVEGLASTVDAYAADVKHVIIESGITELGNGALAKLTALTDAKFSGNAPAVAEGSTPFGTQSDDFVIIVKDGAEGFEGDAWCGYKLEKLEFEYGDVNSDGVITTKDVVLLAQYVAEWGVEINEAVSDVDLSGKLDTKDIILIAQYIAGWDVTLGGGSTGGGSTDEDDTTGGGSTGGGSTDEDDTPDPDPDTGNTEDNEVESDGFFPNQN